MKTLLIPLALILLTSCSKIEELTPQITDQSSGVQVHVYIHKSKCSLRINGEWFYLGDGKSQSVWTKTVEQIDHLVIVSPERGCALTIYNGHYRNELGWVHNVSYSQYNKGD